MTVHGENKSLPSRKWQSFDGWNYNGIKERLERALASIDKSALLAHAESVSGQAFTMSEPFSAGQYWICLELVGKDGRLIIARVRLPRHPETPATVTEEDMEYASRCEVATMQYVRGRLRTVPIPEVISYEPADSPQTKKVGASYMLIEGFYGNTLIDVEFDMTHLPAPTQEHVINQWTKVQAELATLSFGSIGSISSVSPDGQATIGRIASAKSEGFDETGPFGTSKEYFAAVGRAAMSKSSASGPGNAGVGRLGAAVFGDVVDKTSLFDDMGNEQSFPLSHMDLGTQNMLVDGDFNLVAVIDWEFAQSAPWQVNHYPMPFPLLASSAERIESIVADPNHLAHKNVVRQEAARQLYEAGFREAEEALRRQGRPLPVSLARILGEQASQIYVCLTNLGRSANQDEELVRAMVRTAFGWDDERIQLHLEKMKRLL